MFYIQITLFKVVSSLFYIYKWHCSRPCQACFIYK